jgi:hypothetical protein
MDRTARSSSGGFSVLAGAAASALGGIVVNAASAAAGAVVGFVGDSIKAAGGFEANMNQFAAAAGDAMAEAGMSTEQFSDLFLDLGAKLPVSTLEVQEAAIALVKGGLDPAIIAAGGLEASLNFAAAAEMDLAAAAELSIKQLSVFGPVMGTAAEQADFMAHAQNLLVQSANASTVGVEDLGNAMLVASGQAQAIGMDIDEFSTAMGFLSKALPSAAEAGTSFKNFLNLLTPSTADAKGAMAELGLMTTSTGKLMDYLSSQGIQPLGDDLDTLGNQFTEFATAQGWTAKEINKVWESFGQSTFFDEQTGQFLGTAEAAEQLQNAFAGLSDARRSDLLQTIFGNDASAAAQALINGGSEAYNAFAADMAAANGVTAQAAAVNQGFGFAMENLKGTIEGVQIRLGTMLLPTLTQLTQIANNLINAIMGDAAAFAALPGPLQSVITFVQGLVAQAQAFMPVAQQLAGMLAANWQPALAAVAGVIGALVVPALAAFVVAVAPVIAAVVAAIAIGVALHEAWTTNFMGIQTITAAVMATLQMVITQVMTIISAFWQENGAEIIAFTQQAWSQIKEIIGGLAAVISIVVMSVFSTIAAFLKDHGSQIQAHHPGRAQRYSGHHHHGARAADRQLGADHRRHSADRRRARAVHRPAVPEHPEPDRGAGPRLPRRGAGHRLEDCGRPDQRH